MIESIKKQRQNWALMNPAREVADLAHDGYRFDYTIGGVTVCTVLSVNLFEMPLAWHAAIALKVGESKMLTANWSQNDRSAALAAAVEMLDGLGVEGETPKIDAGAQSIELWKPLTIEEATIVANVMAKDPGFGPLMGRMGTVNVYDFTNKQTRVGDTLFLPTETREFYGRAN